MNHYWSVSEPVVVGALTSSGSLTDQYRLIFPPRETPCFVLWCRVQSCSDGMGWGLGEPLIIYGNTPTFAYVVKVGCPLSCIRPLLLAGIALP